MKYLGWSLFFGGIILALVCWGIGADCFRHIYRNNELRYQFLASWCNAVAIMWAVIAACGIGLVIATRGKEGFGRAYNSYEPPER